MLFDVFAGFFRSVDRLNELEVFQGPGEMVFNEGLMRVGIRQTELYDDSLHQRRVFATSRGLIQLMFLVARNRSRG